MLYPKNKSKSLDKSLFENPTCEYRGTPFWSWNCKLEQKQLETQIEYLKEMGFGGFHMHSRTGMATPYLSKEFMDLVKACVDKAENEEMLAWLYDEDRWPSGAAGGIVTKDPKYRAKKLVFSPIKRDDCVSKEEGTLTGKPYLLSCYDIILNETGELTWYAQTEQTDKPVGELWYAYVMTNEPSPWYNNQTYADTLFKEAIARFIEVTYEAYKKEIATKFGNIVPAIFTDEPQFEHKKTLQFALDKQDIVLPWTTDVPETYMQAYGEDILKTIPELFWERADHQISKARYLYHDHIAERFAQAFADMCGDWCEQNNIMLTGHMMEEPTLESQTAALGDAMRSYRSFQLPGIDMLCDRVELTTAKQAQSATHQYGRDGVLSELYGVTNWDFDFRGHKFQGDWQAALGVTVRVPHLSWVSMAGEAKRDYPASISYQSPWYKEYRYVEDHFARLNTVLTRGKPVVKVGMIHPVESYWLHWGPKESTNTIREQLDKNFQDITDWLLLGQIDFDYICESLLPDLCPNASNPLQVGVMEYDTIIVPGCETIRQTTLDRLVEFQKKGGNLIFVGECPKYVDATATDKVKSLYQISKQVPFAHASVLATLDSERVIEIRNSDGTLASNLLYTMREDSDCSWLFIAQGKKAIHVDAVKSQNIVLKIKGEYTPTIYNTISGTTSEIDYEIKGGKTIIHTALYCHDSLLLCLKAPTMSSRMNENECKELKAQFDWKTKVGYTRWEPNVYLMDTAQFAFDDGDYQAEEELLKADNQFRALLGWPSRQDHIAQPWVIEFEKIKHHMRLKFTILSETAVENPMLAIEDAEQLEIALNGQNVTPVVTGYYVDESIQTLNLPSLKQGENILEVKIPFGKRTNVEYCYLLGDFNVRLEGFVKTIVPVTDKIAFGSIVHQGMPFYGGNITYHMDVETSGGEFVIKANNYRGSLIKAKVDGKEAGVICYAPYTISLGHLSEGKHSISLTLYGNRYNTFAALHNADTALNWYGPNGWRSEGDAWCYEYKCKDTGIMASPKVEIYE